MIVKNPSYNTK